jgi:hypothetical protein
MLLRENNNRIYILLFISIFTISTSCGQKGVISESVKEEMNYLDNGVIRVGVNLKLGGAITFLSDSKTKENIINNYDWGRQVQMSFYGGPNPFTPNGKEPDPQWKFLGWNPIQSGDYAKNNGKVIEHKATENSLYIKSIPMQWPLDNEPCDCFFESWITLEGNAVKIKNRIVNQRVDNEQYKGRHQELPAVYTNAKWFRLVSYRGLKPFTNDTLSYIKKLLENYAWEDWQATENWAANVDANDWGLGVWNEGTQEFKGGFAGNWGDQGSEKDYPTAYIAPVQQAILDHNIVYDYQFTLIVGTVTQIREYVYSHHAKNKLPSYHFTSDRQHWIYENATDTGFPINDYLHINLSENSSLLSPVELWEASKAPLLNIEAAYPSGSNQKGKVYWKKIGEKEFTESNSIEFDIQADGNLHRYQIPLSSKSGYSGHLSTLKIVPSIQKSNAGNWVKIKSVGFE